MTRNFKTIYLTIAVQVEDTADCQDVLGAIRPSMETFNIKHPKIIDSEIIEHQVWEEEI